MSTMSFTQIYILKMIKIEYSQIKDMCVLLVYHENTTTIPINLANLEAAMAEFLNFESTWGTWNPCWTARWYLAKLRERWSWVMAWKGCLTSQIWDHLHRTHVISVDRMWWCGVDGDMAVIMMVMVMMVVMMLTAIVFTVLYSLSQSLYLYRTLNFLWDFSHNVHSNKQSKRKISEFGQYGHVSDFSNSCSAGRPIFVHVLSNAWCFNSTYHQQLQPDGRGTVIGIDVDMNDGPTPQTIHW